LTPSSISAAMCGTPKRTPHILGDQCGQLLVFELHHLLGHSIDPVPAGVDAQRLHVGPYSSYARSAHARLSGAITKHCPAPSSRASRLADDHRPLMSMVLTPPTVTSLGRGRRSPRTRGLEQAAACEDCPCGCCRLFENRLRWVMASFSDSTWSILREGIRCGFS
jgi:hypothetical protein